MAGYEFNCPRVKLPGSDSKTCGLSMVYNPGKHPDWSCICGYIYFPKTLNTDLDDPESDDMSVKKTYKDRRKLRIY